MKIIATRKDDYVYEINGHYYVVAYGTEMQIAMVTIKALLDHGYKMAGKLIENAMDRTYNDLMKIKEIERFMYSVEDTAGEQKKIDKLEKLISKRVIAYGRAFYDSCLKWYERREYEEFVRINS